jgi:1-deoxy-D-xylulose 5-phosphate reductoisomerase
MPWRAPQGTTAVLNAANEVAVAAFLSVASALIRFTTSILQL